MIDGNDYGTDFEFVIAVTLLMLVTAIACTVLEYFFERRNK